MAAASFFSWQMAEELAAAHMQSIGFADAKRTATGADRGLDVLAAEAVAQVKHTAQPVSAPTVQQLVGAAHGRGAALFYSTAGYTKQAIEYAEHAGVALFTIDPTTNTVAPLNPEAIGLAMLRDLVPHLRPVLAEACRSQLLMTAWRLTMQHALDNAAQWEQRAALLEAVVKFMGDAQPLIDGVWARLQDVFSGQDVPVQELRDRAAGLRRSFNGVRPALETSGGHELVSLARSALHAMLSGRIPDGAQLVRLIAENGEDPQQVYI